MEKFLSIEIIFLLVWFLSLIFFLISMWIIAIWREKMIFKFFLSISISLSFWFADSAAVLGIWNWEELINISTFIIFFMDIIILLLSGYLITLLIVSEREAEN